MAQKFIITGDIKTGKGYLRFGEVGQHAELRIGYLKRMDRELKGYTVLYQEDWNSDPIEIDTSEIEWI